jgi:beta-phosphoglucomutase-like phosphatase (HAD superfamily)
LVTSARSAASGAATPFGEPADGCLAIIEDSANGLKAAAAAGIPVLITRSEYFRDDDFSSALAVVDELTKMV